MTLSLSLKLRVAGGFIVLVSGFCGVLLPLVAQATHEANVSRTLLLLKAFSAGVVLSLALVHLISDSFTDFGSLPPGDTAVAARAAPLTAASQARCTMTLAWRPPS